MASIATETNGHRRIQFVTPDGKRKTIRLGKVSQRTAEGFKYRVEQLIERATFKHPIEADLAQWVTGLDPKMVGRLVAVRLIEPPEPTPTMTLGEHLNNYFNKRYDVKDGTRTHWRHTEANLMMFFGADRSLESITPGDAKDFERWLKNGDARRRGYVEQTLGDGLAANTVRKRISNTKQFFKDAVERGIINRNPFESLKGSVGSNRARDHFVSREVTAQLIEACPTTEWRLIVALSRYGGLRCPSEHMELTWGDVNWETLRLTVRSPKTEHHAGKGVRQVPVCEELLVHLNEAFAQATPGTVHMLARRPYPHQEFRKGICRLIKRAGVESWPKLFHNLRASRATELAAAHPAHVAAAWLGHSTLIANKHYWQVTDADFDKATSSRRGDTPTTAPGAKVAQNPAQHPCADVGINKKRPSEGLPKPLEIPSYATSSELVHKCLLGGTGFEPVTSTV